MFDGPLTAELDPGERRARLRLARSARIGPVTFHEALAHFGSAQRRLRAAGHDHRCRDRPRGRGARQGRRPLPGVRRSRLSAGAGRPAGCAAGPVGHRRSRPARPAHPGRGRRPRGLAWPACRSGRRAGRRAGRGGLRRRLRPGARHRCGRPPGGAAPPAPSPCWPAASTRSTRRRTPACTPPSPREGLLLSESPLGTPPVARAFPRRNRIVSGLSKGVVVIEAAARSGSLITAHRAAEQGREVFVVPGSPIDPRYAGSNSLIRDGAILTRDANDILGVLGAATVRRPSPCRNQGENPARPGGRPRCSSALGSVPTAVDELVRRCQVSAAAVAEVLLALELEGRLERHRGNRVSLI